MKINKVTVGTTLHGPQKHAEIYVQEGDPRLGRYDEVFEFAPGTVQSAIFNPDGSITQTVIHNDNTVSTDITTFPDENTIIQDRTAGDVTMRLTTTIDQDGNMTTTHQLLP